MCVYKTTFKLHRTFKLLMEKNVTKKTKGGTSKEGIKSGSIESITTERNFCAVPENHSPDSAPRLSSMDYRGIPLCNRGRLLAALSSFFIAAPFLTRSHSLYPFFPQGSSSRKHTLFPQRPTSRIILHASAKNRYLLQALLYTF